MTQTLIETDRPADVELHPLLAHRWSPRSFTPAALSDDDLTLMLHAARWASSSMNGQPWSFVVGRKGSAAHARMVAALAPSNQLWAVNAPVLIIAAAQIITADGSPHRSSLYDLGLSVGQLVLQAGALGYHVHQMGGFDRDAMATAVELPEDVAAVVTLAIGRLGDADALPEAFAERERAPRTRKSLSEIAFAGTHGTPLA